VVQATGDVRIRQASDDSTTNPWQPLQQGARISSSAQIETGANGQASLSRGEDVMQIVPLTRMEIPAQSPASFFTRIRVFIGKMFFEVDKRPGQDFQVDTPYRAAIVKGTSFSVTANGQQSNVAVAEGSVGVSSNATGQSVVIGPGQFARVTSDAASGVSVGTFDPDTFEDPGTYGDGDTGSGDTGGEGTGDGDTGT
jgi:hypothetical protein